MLTQIIVGLLVAGVAIGVALVLKRRSPEGPPRDAFPVPRQLDRNDFNSPSTPWLVAYFSSLTCDSCVDLGPKVAALASDLVAVDEISYERQRDLHTRYEIAGLPMILIADSVGVVARAFVGSISASDLWASLAECREPGSTPDPDLGIVR